MLLKAFKMLSFNWIARLIQLSKQHKLLKNTLTIFAAFEI